MHFTAKLNWRKSLQSSKIEQNLFISYWEQDYYMYMVEYRYRHIVCMCFLYGSLRAPTVVSCLIEGATKSQPTTGGALILLISSCSSTVVVVLNVMPVMLLKIYLVLIFPQLSEKFSSFKLVVIMYIVCKSKRS